MYIFVGTRRWQVRRSFMRTASWRGRHRQAVDCSVIHNELFGSTDNIVRKFIPMLLREIPMLARIARVALYFLL